MEQNTLHARAADGGTEQATQKVSDVAGQAQEAVQEKAQDVRREAGTQVRQQVDQRSTEAGERVTQTASDIRSVGEQLRVQGKDAPAKLAERAADQAERVGDYLRRSDADRILRDAEDFGRRQPWAVLAGGLAAGFAASRFLKASSGERYRSSSPSPAAQPARTPLSAGNGHSTNPVGSTAAPPAAVGPV